MYLKKELYGLIKTDESIFDFIQESALDGLWYWDLENTENEWMNARFWTVLGYNPDEMPHKSMAWQNIINQDDLKLASDNFTKHCENRNHPYDQVVRYTHKNGSTVWIRCRGMAIRDKDGKPIRMLGAHQDVSDIKYREQELIEANEKAEESEMRFRSTFDKSPVGSVIVGLDKCFIKCNEAFCNFVGYTNDELIGKTIADITYSKDTDLAMSDLKLLMEGKIESSAYIQKRYLHKDGFILWGEVSISLVRDSNNKPLYFLPVITDITERKQAEEALRKSEAFKKKMVSNISDVVVIIDQNGINQYKSPNITRWFGWKPEELVGKNTWDNIHPDDLEAGQHFFGTILTESNASGITEMRYKRKDGHYIWIEINAINLLHDKDIQGILGNYRDITERKEAAQALKESELKFRALFEKGPIGVAYHKMVYDSTGKPIDYLFLDANEAYQELTGVDPRGKLVTEAFPGIENDTSDWIGVFGKVALTGETTRIERYLEANQRWYDCVGYQYKPDHFVAAFLEVTNRKKTEIQLQEVNENLIQKNAEIKLNNERLESLLKITQFQTQSIQELLDFALEEAIELTNSKIGYIYFYQETTRQFILNTWSNDVMKECSVINPQTVYDLDKTGCWGEAVRQRKPILINNYQDVNPIKRGTPEGHLQLLKFLTIPVIMEGKIVAVAGVANKDTDYDDADIRQLTLLMDNVWKISERLELVNNLERAKEKAEENELFYRQTFEKSAVGVAHVKPDGQFIKMNQPFCEIVGYTCDELLAMDFADITFPDDLKKEELFIEKIINNEINTFSIEKRYIHKKGHIIWISMHSSVVRDNNNQILFAIATIFNITEQKKLQNELIKAKERAEESDRLKSAFLANMSHEIRTPMNGILGFTELLLEPDLSSEEKEAYINIVNQSGQRMLNTVNDIVEISKIEAGIVTVNLKEVNVQEILLELIRFFTPEATKKGLQLTLENEVPKTLTVISTDKNKLDSILTNLMKNAIKYTESGTIKVGCTLETHSKVSLLRFYVKDTGIGIPEDRQQAVFDRFVQADMAITRQFDGSGLGLAITKAYVEMLGGEIGLKSTASQGATFFFSLPLSGQDQEKTEEIEIGNQHKETKEAKGLHILISEDDQTSAHYLQTILRKGNHKILLTQNGHEAVEICRNTPDVDLVLMDIQMPGMNGYEASREIRKFNKQVVIIAQTAFAISGDKEKALEAGCNDYISKPIKKNELIGIIQRHIKNSIFT